MPGNPLERRHSLDLDTSDPAPLSARQIRALIGTATRELAWGLPRVAREVRSWRARARSIPDAPIREDALSALRDKRAQSDGAALFSTLPRERDRDLLALLVAYQIGWDFLDSVSERSAAAGRANGRQLHLALVDALDPARPIADYYRHNPWREDGGYLCALVAACRTHCTRLPAYARIRRIVVRDALRAEVLAINHDLDPARRDAALEAWAAGEFPTEHAASWFELTGAASAGLAGFALLALASEPACTDGEIARSHGAYFPWASALAAMLDSYVDQSEDAANGDHSYIAHYPTAEQAIHQICRLVGRCLREAHGLPDGERHTLITACMVAMYLSKDSALTPALHDRTGRIVDAGGSLTRALVPILRLWRIAYGQR